MRKRIVFTCLVLFCLVAAGAHAQSGGSVDERKLLEFVNQERERVGIPRLSWNEHLAKSARGHALQLARWARLSHQFQGEPALSERIGGTGLRFESCAENVAYAMTVEEAHYGLMHSPPHREAILNANYNSAGISIIAQGDTLYVAQNFAHVVPTYTATQFRDAVVAAFNKARTANGFLALDSRPDFRLEQAACSNNMNAQEMIAGVREASDLVIFTSAIPEKLPNEMQRAATKSRLDRMSLGVCFKPGSEQGYASFKVVAAFFAPHY